MTSYVLVERERDAVLSTPSACTLCLPGSIENRFVSALCGTGRSSNVTFRSVTPGGGSNVTCGMRARSSSTRSRAARMTGASRFLMPSSSAFCVSRSASMSLPLRRSHDARWRRVRGCSSSLSDSLSFVDALVEVAGEVGREAGARELERLGAGPARDLRRGAARARRRCATSAGAGGGGGGVAGGGGGGGGGGAGAVGAGVAAAIDADRLLRVGELRADVRRRARGREAGASGLAWRAAANWRAPRRPARAATMTMPSAMRPAPACAPLHVPRLHLSSAACELALRRRRRRPSGSRPT